MRVRSLALETVLALARLGGARVTDRGDFIAIATPGEPDYYYGNLLVLPAAPQVGEVAYWTRRFADEFAGDAGIAHVTLWWDGTSGDVGARDELVAAGFAIEEGVVMAAQASAIARAVDAGAAALPIRELAASEVDAIAELGFAIAEHHDDPHRRFLERRAASHARLVAAGAARFYGAFDGDALVASLGLAELGAQLARYQDVQTALAYRKRGLASALLARAAASVAADTRLVLLATADGDAARLYERVGFRAAERTVSACRYPR